LKPFPLPSLLQRKQKVQMSLQPQPLDADTRKSSALMDEDLMLRVAQGDQQAFDLLVKRHLSRVYATARGMVYRQTDAEDVAQDVFMRVWMYAKRWRPGEAAVTTWLHRIVVNCCYDHLRKQGKQPFSGAEIETLVDDAKNAEGKYADEQKKQKIRSALKILPERQRMAVTLCYLQELTNVEAAKAMDTHIKALEGLLVRARKALRPILEGL
jgi:RNA polymerase sigma-70 factor, ECF subfamily